MSGSDTSETSGSSSSSDSDDEATVAMLRKLSHMDINNKPACYKGTGLVYDELMTKHKFEWDPNYPENPLRITEPYRRCSELGLVDRSMRLQMKYATEDEILDVHSQDLLNLAQQIPGMKPEEHRSLGTHYDCWYCNKETYEAALAAAGSSMALMDSILHDEINNGFALIRPPGHHGMKSDFCGYCTFNNVAITAESAFRKGVQRILIVDWDVHHGQGIQRHFYSDPRVLYFSIHRYEYGRFWPELRDSDYDYIGEKDGVGYNINLPLNKIGMTNSDYMAIFHQLLLPIAYEFSPQLILVSSGYDSSIGCPEGEMLVTPAMYGHMTHHLMALAEGRVCSILEGGYCIKSLAEGCAHTLRVLLQDPCSPLGPLGEPSDSIVCSILNVIKMLRPYWSCFSHYQVLNGTELCPFQEVNTMPPIQGVVFNSEDEASRTCFASEAYKYPVLSSEIVKLNSELIDQAIKDAKLTVATYRCCYVFDADMRGHVCLGYPHPECPDRISRIYTKLVEWQLLKRCLEVPSRLARKSELLQIHTEEYIEELRVTQTMSKQQLDKLPREWRSSSIYFSPKSLHCALLSCGSVLNVVEAVLTDQAQSGVAIVRPPGHHAECSKAMGFCFFNNVAVATKFAQKHYGLKRILIVDWDIHHGNGTQHQFYSDPSVLYISLHRYDGGMFYPGSTDADAGHVGEGPGKGFNVNIPWNMGKMGDSEYVAAFNQIVMPIAYQFGPELVLVSAGFDAAIGDPLGGYRVSPACYGHMTHMLRGVANGRVVLILEGGYNLHSISESMGICTSVLLGDPCPLLDSVLVTSDSALETINKVLDIQKQYWSCLKHKVKIPFKEWRKEEGERKSARIKQQRAQSAKQLGTAFFQPLSRVRPHSARPDSSTHTSDSGLKSTTITVSDDNITNITTASTSHMGAITTLPSNTTTTSSITSDATLGTEATLEMTSTPAMPDQKEHSRGLTSHGGDVCEGTPDVDEVTSAFKNMALADVRHGDYRGPLPQPGQCRMPVRHVHSSAVSGEQDPLADHEWTEKAVFRSTVYANIPAEADVISIFVGSQAFTRASENVKRRKEKKKKKSNERAEANATSVCENLKAVTSSVSPTPMLVSAPVEAGTCEDNILDKNVAVSGGSSSAGPGRSDNVSGACAEAASGEAMGACGGSLRPKTVSDLLSMQGVEQMFAIQPLSWCPHLAEVTPLPSMGLCCSDPCKVCSDPSENWVCLICYEVACSRFVNEHMLFHRLETEHNMTLSFSDLSVWCYACDHYVDNKILFPMKNAAHISKFGEPLPGQP